ncbi:amidohydrolase family protein [Luteimonas sp. BDR2-5]|uniref:amidohydrolase family protein n=1 Tax=Proluteimonas luteida TaxID=2878685 RepID=UPI001E29265D|nr:amidohydrolase family protein [Luteimonas sp. BDR2-5]MCD9029729.1 amidohydrolase family protein [Luteimonas sp. BDR2-5]
MHPEEPEDRFEIDPPPHPRPAPPSRFRLPPGAVDTHAHVIGDSYIAERSYTPTPASVEEYLGMLDAVGMTYGVLVQPSVHGVDNTLMCGALRANRARLRGIAVTKHDANDAELAVLKDAGVVGLRLNTTTGGGVGISHLDRYAAMCEELDWHLQFLVEPRQLASLAQRVARLNVPVVIDHMGYVDAGPGMEQPQQALLEMVSRGAWVKLSGAFRVSRLGAPYTDTLDMTRRLAEAAPDRCVWGSDWPHVKYRREMPDPGELLDVLARAVTDPQRLQMVLAENAQRLYGFSG